MSSSERREGKRSAVTFMLAGEEEGDPILSRLEAGLAIDVGKLEDELARQPDRYYRASLRAARLEARVADAEAEARAAEGRVVMYLREQAEDRASPPPDAILLARARQHADVDAAERRARELRRRLLAARALESAYAQRMRALEVIATASAAAE